MQLLTSTKAMKIDQPNWEAIVIQNATKALLYDSLARWYLVELSKVL
jgi:hypothetical protein